MKKYWPIVPIFLGSFLFSSCSHIDESLTTSSRFQQSIVTPSPQPSSTPSPAPTDFTARFEIYTNGTKRVFTESKYHRQSAQIYIENPDPHQIQVKAANLTWNDFFNTLPFSVQKECLITGTKQTFCNTETKKLYFLLNNKEEPNALEKVIAPNDFLRIEYR